nr:MAG: hypothetical protein [Betatorquevirus sp.]
MDTNNTTNERDHGRRKPRDTAAARARPTVQPTTPAATQTTNIIQQPINIKCIKKVYLFDPPKPRKNERFTGWDWETELQLCKAFKRPMRTFKNDPPYYPWLPPEPIVNFDLNFNKGQH